MASLISPSIFSFLNPIFVFLFTYALIYAVLTKTKVLGDNKGISSVLALVVAFFVSSASDYTLISAAFPPFILVLLFFVFLLLIGHFLGLGPSNFVEIFGKEKGASWFVFIIVMILIVAIFANFYGGKLLEKGTEANATESQSEFEQNLIKIFFNENVLGLILVLLVAFMAMRFISGT
ncbi:MAG: hypothetical protein PWP03_849 [Candidatus Woesearchaeota archaeon]|nr:hypothetical protein [Candidatus Woesearchaeota archaeon]MDN5328211.1 hypothetical protein [Candidatus Woesearchaeota archaeon]